MIKDNLNQDVNIGDWIATIPQGSRTVIIGKVTSITKAGNPMIKRNHKANEEATGKTVESRLEGPGNPKYVTSWNPLGQEWKEYRKPHFIKIIPTREIELNYENI
jgi:hypothetical protein